MPRVGTGIGLGQPERRARGPRPTVAANARAARRCRRGSSGSEPIVTCACHAAATDWSARPICSIAATKPTVDMPMPPHSSGISMPSRPERAHLAEQVGRAPRLRPTRAARARDLLLRELAAEAHQIALDFGEREVHGRIYWIEPVRQSGSTPCNPHAILIKRDSGAERPRRL